MNILAIIPARGGSKGIKDKNIIELAGHPLIAYSIAAAKSSNMIDRIICSTDSKIIAEIAKKYGAEIPFIRPSMLAQDDTPDYPVFMHAVKWLIEKEDYCPDIIVQLRPTSPIRFTSDIDIAIDNFKSIKGADSLRAVCKAPGTPYKMWLKDDKFIKPLMKIEGVKEPYNMPRQKLPEVFWQTGYIDILHYRTLLELKSMTGRHILPYFIDRSIVVDIDSEFDLQHAEKIIKETTCVKP